MHLNDFITIAAFFGTTALAAPLVYDDEVAAMQLGKRFQSGVPWIWRGAAQHEHFDEEDAVSGSKFNKRFQADAATGAGVDKRENGEAAPEPALEPAAE